MVVAKTEARDRPVTQLQETMVGEAEDTHSYNRQPESTATTSNSEPKYCYCHGPEKGRMLGCDNPSRPIEWFHLKCLNLRTVPTGKWYCPDCQKLSQFLQGKKKKLELYNYNSYYNNIMLVNVYRYLIKWYNWVTYITEGTTNTDNAVNQRNVFTSSF